MNVKRDKSQYASVHIRWMIRRDMPEVLDIEQGSFEFPWIEEDFVNCLRQRNCIGMVAEYDGNDWKSWKDSRVAGFMIYELHKSRIHVLNFAVHPDWRGESIGWRMNQKLIGKLSASRRTQITLQVRETNLSAQLFFRSCGYRAISVLRGYYEDTPEDAYIMRYRYQPIKEEIFFPVNRIARLVS